MQLKEIVLDGTLREVTPRGTPSFPIEMYCNNICDFPTRYVPWHWHEEVEFGYVVDGRMTVEHDGGKAGLSTGDGFFVNSNRLHAMRPVGSGDCRTVNIVFHPEIVGGAPHSVYENAYVVPLLKNEAVSLIVLKSGEEWQLAVLDLLKKLYREYTDAKLGYEIKIRSGLSEIWLSLFRRYHRDASFPRPKPQGARIKKILSYLQEHYQDPVTLEEIAENAGVGVRTCCRCFKEYTGMTPFEYLLEYRVKRAAELLDDPGKSVTEVCFSAGFNDTSYFAKTFRRLTGYTPSQFRRRNGRQSRG